MDLNGYGLKYLLNDNILRLLVDAEGKSRIYFSEWAKMNKLPLPHIMDGVVFFFYK